MAECWRGNPSYTITTHVDGLMDSSENFDSNDNLIASSSMRDASNTAGSGYDSLNRPVAQRNSRTGVSTTAYLSTTADLVASVTATDSTTTAFTYDIRGRRTAVDAPNAGGHDNITYTSYYPTGQVKASWGDQTYPRYHVYDGQNRLTALHTYNTAPTGEPTGSGDSVTTWVYNTQRGWLDRKVYPATGGSPATAGATDYTYTDAGRLATREWARGVITTYNYDTAGRLTLLDYSDTTPDVAYTYDSLGRVLTANNTVSANSYAYNANLTLATETVTIVEGASSLLTRTIERSYDTLLRPTGNALKDGATTENATTYTYDLAGRLATVTGGAINGNPGSDFTYDYVANSYGLVQSVTSPAHTVTNAWETDRNVLLDKKNDSIASTSDPVSQFTYLVNDIGQRESLATSGTAFNSDFRTLDWAYDALGQVVAEADSGATPDSRAFEFDAIGNRKKSADSLTLPTSDNYVVNALNQYTTVNANNPDYDDDGNLLDDAGINTGTSGDRNFIWDAENRLIEVKDESDGTTIATYSYDYIGRRVRKTVTSGEDTVFLYDGWNVVAEYSALAVPSSALTVTYTWGTDLSGSMQGAGGVGGLLAVNDGTNTYYPTYDGNGNVSEYLNASGAHIAHYEYDAFGKIVKSTGSSEDFRYRFSTKPLDEEIGWYYYGYRYYDPLTGRWPSRDPIEEQGGYNLYGFVGNDGVNKVDLYGAISSDEIESGRAQYTCNCGFIDWGHLNPRSARVLYHVVASGIGTRYITAKRKGFVAVGYGQYQGINKWGIKYKVGAERHFDVKEGLTPEQIKQVALGIFMHVSEAFESYQGTNPATSGSSFSGEDLVSNLLSFYRAVEGYSIEEIKSACKPLSKEHTLDVWNEIGGSLPKNENWSPLLFNDKETVKKCCKDTKMSFPEKFQKIVPVSIEGPLLYSHSEWRK